MINVAPIWLPELQQQNYRVVLEAMSRPGHCQNLFFDGEQQAYIALLASLLDQAVTLADPHGLIHEDDFALLQSQRIDPEQADFILCRGAKPSYSTQIRHCRAQSCPPPWLFWWKKFTSQKDSLRCI